MSSTIFPTIAPTLTPANMPEINNVGSRIRPVVVGPGKTTELNVLNNDVPARPLPNPLRVTRIVEQATYGRCQVLRETVTPFAGIDVSYAAEPGYTGKDSCSYRACDSRGQCGDAFIFVDVEATRPPSRRPTRQPTSTPSINPSGSVLRPVPVAAGGTTSVNVLENDEAATGTRLSVTGITQNAMNGNCAVDGTRRRVEYTPNAGFSGRDACEYEACDNRGDCGTARVYVRVVGGGSPAPTPSEPVTVPTVRPDGSLSDPIELPKDGSVTVAVLDNDTSGSPPPNPLTVTAIANDANFGSCTVQDGGKKVRYVPNEGYSGPDGCVYRACDTRDQCGEATVFVSVTTASAVPTKSPSAVPVDTPVIRNDGSLADPIETDFNMDRIAVVLGNDTPADGAGPLTVVEIPADDQALHGRCTVVEGRTVRYAPDQDYFGPDRCDYVACDTKGQCGSATVFFRVLPPPPPPPSKAPTEAPSGVSLYRGGLRKKLPRQVALVN